ncbi:MAG: FtsX-like permease family protein [Dehalococcoidia bacterium]|nr:FtsX-like permease family protein [Dehalococcoidia bacterium]
MDELFGVSMNLVMVILVAIFGLCLATVAYVALRNRLIFVLGLRNIPRRKAQSILVVVGLMLSSLIITASLTTGDTIDRSITAAVYQTLGPVDEIVAVDIEDEAASREELFFDYAFFEGVQEAVADDPNIDGIAPGLFETVNAFSLVSNLSEPATTLVGLGVEWAGDFGTYDTVDGESIALADLETGQALINEELSDNLDIGAGDEVSVFASGSQGDFTVAAVVENTLLAGDVLGGEPTGPISSVSRNGIVVPLTVAQEIVGRPGSIDRILVSNAGDDRSGVSLTDDVTEVLDQAAASAHQEVGGEGFAPEVSSSKAEGLEEAELIGNLFSTLFVIFGLFSIAAGILLIFLIFVMLAAERRSEMGMSRAVGMRRSHLVQMFISEGMAYDAGAALVGTILGVGVAFLLVSVMVSVFAIDIPLEYAASPRSLVIAISLAMSLTFLTIFISSLNVSRLNIVLAIADLPQPAVRRTRNAREVLVGFALTFYTLLLVAIPIGLLIMLISGLEAVGFLVFLVLLAATIAARPVRRILYRPLGSALGPHRGHVLSVLGLFVGVAALVSGLTGALLAPFTMGFSLIVICSVFLLSNLTRISIRALWTTASLILLVFWLLPGDWFAQLFGEMTGDFEMFFVSGVFIVVASTLFLVFNADLLLVIFRVLGSRMSAYLPAFKMAIVYPLASRLRTGLTLAMFSLIMFAIVMMAIINSSFLRAFSSDEAAGGWDVLVTTSPNTQIESLRDAVGAGGGDAEQLQEVGLVTLASLFGAEAQQSSFIDPDDADDTEPGVVSLWGGDTEFLEHNQMPLQTIADGYGSAEEVWQAIAQDPSLAVVDATAVTGFSDIGETVDFRIEGVEPTDDTMEPIEVSIANPAGGADLTVTVIGVIDETVVLARGLFTGLEAIAPLYGDGDLNQFFVNVPEGADDEQVARDVESSLVTQGVQAQSLNELLQEFQAQQTGFLYLLEGFMSMGLLVGVAALGVISLRSVVERRQQIGMMRALGFRGSMVSLAFMLESGFIALTGLVTGILLALVLAFNLLSSDDFSGSGEIGFYVPWDQVALFGGLAFIASLIMTWFPAQAASKVPVAEALRYE